MTLPAGKRLGPYDLLGSLEAAEMGQVEGFVICKSR